MSLTTGRGPLSAEPTGRFYPPLAGEFSYVEPFPRRVLGRRDGQVVVDSERVLLVHRRGRPPEWAFPAEEVHVAQIEDTLVDGYVLVAWDAVDEWYEEGTQVFGHPRNPYHRIDCLPTDRRLRVTLGSMVLVDSTETVALYETSLSPRLYVGPDAVRTDLLHPSATRTYCPYKGTASYFDAELDGRRFPDIVWSYPDPLPESTPITGLLCFDPARVDVSEAFPLRAEPT